MVKIDSILHNTHVVLERMRNGMEWREIDTMMISKCIEFIEKEITDGKLEASRFIPVPELKP